MPLTPAFDVAAGCLSPLEARSLRRIAQRGASTWRRLTAAGGAIRLEIVEDPLFAVAGAPPWGEPARVSAHGEEVRLAHAAFHAGIDPTGVVRLYRETSEAFPLEITLRTALCGLLPGAGGLPFHAAGVVAGGGLVFFGPSGAGKSTLAGSSPFTVLSDELVAVVGEPWALVESGFFGELEPAANGREGEAPLAALFELEKAPEFRLARLESRAAARRLLASLLVPPAPQPWRAALAALARLTERVPVYRLGWRREEPPCSRLAAALPELGIPNA